MELYKEILSGYRGLFQKAKHEVFVLIRDDNYSRWRRTDSFKHFFDEMKTYHSNGDTQFVLTTLYSLNTSPDKMKRSPASKMVQRSGSKLVMT